MRGTLLIAVCLVLPIACAAAESPTSRLLHARTLKCYFTGSNTIWIRNGHRTIESNTEKGEITYDSIDLQKGSARAIGNVGAADVSVRSTQGEIWITEVTDLGNLVVSTVFPLYVEGTEDFVILESRHTIAGTIVLGEQSSGGCKLLQ
jgi:hypothetical protein